MNRFKREERSKHEAIREGMSPLEIKRLDREESLNRKIFELARTIHIDKYPEEYSHIFDDHVDYAMRRKGNPMSKEYAATVAHSRAEQGVEPLGNDGMPVSTDTWKIAYAEAEALVRSGEPE